MQKQNITTSEKIYYNKDDKSRAQSGSNWLGVIVHSWRKISFLTVL